MLDPARTLPGCDPDLRFAQMSLGAALENLLVAARAWGQQPTVHYLPWGLASRPGAAARHRFHVGQLAAKALRRRGDLFAEVF